MRVDLILPLKSKDITISSYLRHEMGCPLASTYILENGVEGTQALLREKSSLSNEPSDATSGKSASGEPNEHDLVAVFIVLEDLAGIQRRVV